MGEFVGIAQNLATRHERDRDASPIIAFQSYAPWLAGPLIGATMLAAVALPLATYTTALALFGFAHVMSELRYVDLRFSRRLGGLASWLGLPLGVAILCRVASGEGWLTAQAAIGIELCAVAAMAAAIVPRMRRRRWAGAAAAAAIGGAAVLAPLEAFVLLAVAHNLTPLGLVAEALRGPARRRMLAALSLPFLIVPVVIATGLPYAFLAMAGATEPEATIFAAGPLDLNLIAYVPRSLHDSPWAVHLFSAAVFAQCMHYAVVIGLLPRLIASEDARRETVLPWPATRRFWGIVAVSGAALVVAFATDFGTSRQLYGLLALVHAWIEVPMLLLALDGDGVNRRLEN